MQTEIIANTETQTKQTHKKTLHKPVTLVEVLKPAGGAIGGAAQLAEADQWQLTIEFPVETDAKYSEIKVTLA